MPRPLCSLFFFSKLADRLVLGLEGEARSYNVTESVEKIRHYRRDVVPVVTLGKLEEMCVVDTQKLHLLRNLRFCAICVYCAICVLCAIWVRMAVPE